MSTGTFDPEVFLSQTTTEAGATEYVPLDEGEYTAVAGEPTFRPWSTTKNGVETSGMALDIIWEIDDAGQREKLARDTVVCKQGMFLDMTADGTSVNWGKGHNVPLGRLREALDLNKPGESFSFRMITGKVAKVAVKNSIRKDTGEIISNVVAVMKLT